VQAFSHTVADRTHRWSKVPNVRAFDRCSDNKQGQGCVVTTIVAKTPVRPEANYPVRALVRVESKCSEGITQRSTQDVHHSKWCPAEVVRRGT
jgi:hypothetical protein